MTKTLPTSGYEPVFMEIPWGTPKGIVNNNCYSFALDDYSESRPIKAVPGDVAGVDPPFDHLTCTELKRRVLADNPGAVYSERPSKTCRKGYYKVQMFIDSRDPDFADFHWYRQHRDVLYTIKPGDTLESIAKFFGRSVAYIRKHNPAISRATKNLFLPRVNVWAHKLGHATGPLLQDSCGKAIKDPRKACRSYDSHTYNTYCSSYCVKRGAARTS
jgi:hypothetical protein